MPNGFGFLECALELGTFMGIPILTPRELLEEIGEAPGG